MQINTFSGRTVARRQWMAVALCVLAAGCAGRMPVAGPTPAGGVPRFSEAPLGSLMQQGWHPWFLSRFAKRTDYHVVESEIGNVVEARAVSSSSGMLTDIDVDPRLSPMLSWTWKATALMPGADLSVSSADDSPTRLIVAFDGDRRKFDFEDRAMASMVRLVSGRDMPYATLMYVWDNKLPVETILEHPQSSRLKAIVVESGPARVGQWLSFSRNIEADFERVFGEKPVRIESIGVMTDSNQTASSITSFYGDIAFRPASTVHASRQQ
jgi:hypothetical protein